MRIVGIYSFNQGREVIEADFATELQEIKEVIAGVDATEHKTKVSREKTMPDRVLYKPGSLNKAFKREFGVRGWRNHKIAAEYPTGACCINQGYFDLGQFGEIFANWRVAKFCKIWVVAPKP